MISIRARPFPDAREVARRGRRVRPSPETPADQKRERGLSGKVRLALDIRQVSLFVPTTDQRL
jgi:hypothetical protein